MVPSSRDDGGEKRGGRFDPGPKDDSFRCYSFIAVGAKRKDGQYLYRNSLYRLAQTKRVVKKYGPKVIRLRKAVATHLRLKSKSSG